MKDSSKKEKTLIVIGLLLIGFGILSNEWIIAALFSPDGLISSKERMIIWVFDLLLIGFGTSTILYRNSNIMINIYISLCSLLFMFIVTELYFSLFNPQYTENSEHDGLFEYHSTFGWQFIPHTSGRMVLPYEHETNVIINSVGMRDREYNLTKPKRSKRIVVIGDSFTSGLSVDDNEVFTEVMEDSLLSNIEVLNFGVNGFGPTQEFLILKDKGLEYNPDIVVMVIYIRNDFDDIIGTFNWIKGYQRPRAILNNDGEITFENIPVPPPIIVESRVVVPLPTLHSIQFIKRRLIDKYNIVQMPPEVRLGKKQYSAEITMAYDLMKSIIESTYSLCRENGAEFVVVIAPTIVQVYEEKYWTEIKQLYNIDDNLYDLYLPNKELKRMCLDQGINVLDLTPILKSYAILGSDLYYSRNKHWNAIGHSIVAREIVEYLIDNNLLASNDLLIGEEVYE